MNTRKPDSFKAFERAFEWFLIGGAILLLVALSFAYFGIPSLRVGPVLTGYALVTLGPRESVTSELTGYAWW